MHVNFLFKGRLHKGPRRVKMENRHSDSSSPDSEPLPTELASRSLPWSPPSHFTRGVDVGVGGCEMCA